MPKKVSGKQKREGSGGWDFSWFDGEWEKRKFGDLGSVVMCKGFLKSRQRQLEKSHL